MSNGRTLRRNRQHILKTKSVIPSQHDSDDDSSLIDITRDLVDQPPIIDNDYDSDATIPFMEEEDEPPQPRSTSGRTLKAPKHLRDYVTK